MGWWAFACSIILLFGTIGCFVTVGLILQAMSDRKDYYRGYEEDPVKWLLIAAGFAMYAFLKVYWACVWYHAGKFYGQDTQGEPGTEPNDIENLNGPRIEQIYQNPQIGNHDVSQFPDPYQNQQIG